MVGCPSDQWELLDCNGHGPSVLCVKLPYGLHNNIWSSYYFSTLVVGQIWGCLSLTVCNNSLSPLYNMCSRLTWALYSSTVSLRYCPHYDIYAPLPSWTARPIFDPTHVIHHMIFLHWRLQGLCKGSGKTQHFNKLGCSHGFIVHSILKNLQTLGKPERRNYCLRTDLSSIQCEHLTPISYPPLVAHFLKSHTFDNVISSTKIWVGWQIYHWMWWRNLVLNWVRCDLLLIFPKQGIYGFFIVCCRCAQSDEWNRGLMIH